VNGDPIHGVSNDVFNKYNEPMDSAVKAHGSSVVMKRSNRGL